MSDSALIGAGDLDAPFATRAGATISRRRFLADQSALAERLPANGPWRSRVSAMRYEKKVCVPAPSPSRWRTVGKP